MHDIEPQPPGGDALAIADQGVEGLHDEHDGGQHLPVDALRLLLVAAAHALEDAHLVVEGVGGGDHSRAAGAQVVGQLQAAAAVEDRQRPGQGLDAAADGQRRTLALEEHEVRPDAGQLQQGVVGQAHADVFGGVLNRDRQVDPLHHPREELRVVGLGHAALGRRLQDQPGCAGRPGVGSEGSLLLDARAGHRDGHRYPPRHLLGDPIDQGPPLGLGQLVHFGAQAEHGNAVGAPADAAPEPGGAWRHDPGRRRGRRMRTAWDRCRRKPAVCAHLLPARPKTQGRLR